MEENDLIIMMFRSEPIESFEKLFAKEPHNPEWEELLDMCYSEEAYESVGGDCGDEEDPPVNHNRLKYLGKLIEFLESKGIKVVT